MTPDTTAVPAPAAVPPVPADPLAGLKLPKLDASRAYGEIHGVHEFADACFSQDGFLFRQNGTLVAESLTERDIARLQDVARRDAAVAEAKAILRDRLDGTPGFDAATIDRLVNTAALDGADEDEVDLIAWANGERLYPFPKVSSKFKAMFGAGINSKAQGYAVLAREGLIAPRGAFHRDNLPMSSEN